MPECTVANCTEQAKWSTIVRSDAVVNGSRHEVTALYCDEHLASQRARLGVTPGVSLTDIERLPECSCAMTEETFRSCPVHGEDAPDPDAETGRRLASEREDLIAAGVNPGDLVIPIHPKDHVTLPECRHLICEQPAEFEVTVRYFGGVRERKALYCTKHLTVVQEVLATRETSEITNIRPLKGTTVTNKETLSAEIDRLQEKNDELNEAVRRLNADNQNLEGVNTSLNNSVRTADAAIGRLKKTNDRLAEEIGTLRGDRDALINALHGLGNEMDAIGNDDAVRLIDDILEKGKYPARIKHFEIIVTVPAQVRIKVDAKDKDTAREMFDQGRVQWRSEDYEEFLDDDTEVVEIVEVEQ